MRTGDADSAVRILPADDAPPPRHTPAEPPRRWFIPLVVVLAVVGVFVAATRPSAPEQAPTTQPDRLAAVDDVLIDLSGTAELTMAGQPWERMPFDGEEALVTAFEAGSSFVAIESGSEPTVWISGTGGTWRKVGRLELPVNQQASIEHAVVWEGDIVALGPVGDDTGVWTAASNNAWDYQGVTEMGNPADIEHLVAGPSLLAVSDQSEGWTSKDGIEWAPIGALRGLDKVTVKGFVDAGEQFLAFGADGCRFGPGVLPGIDPDCRAAVLRSTNGVDWERADVDADTSSMVTDLVVTDTGMVAAGWISSDREVSVATWYSSDGANWNRQSEDQHALQQQAIEIDAVTARGGENPWAELAIDGSTYDVGSGTELHTAVGLIEIGSITDTSIELNGDAGGLTLGIGQSAQLGAKVFPHRLAVEGSRQIVAGRIETVAGRSLPTVWLSNDYGHSWERHLIGTDTGAAEYPMIRAANLVVVGLSEDGPAVWRTGWDTAVVTRDAEQVTVAYLDALDRYDAGAVAEVLPPSDRMSVAPSFMTPTLGEVVHSWWDPETGDLAPDRIEDTVGYLRQTGVHIDVTQCTSNATLGTVVRANVRCEYTVSSHLLDLFDGGTTGAATALVRDGVLVRVHLNDAPSILMWEILAPALKDAASTSVANTRLASWPGLEFTPATALQHQEKAEQYLAGLLTPGKTVVVSTEFGPMEWSWVEAPEELGDWAGPLIWTEQGFIYAGYHNVENNEPALSFWQSQDGVGWNPLLSPPGITNVWHMLPFGDGFVVAAFHEEAPSISYFDGTAWSQVEMPIPEGADAFEYFRVAVSGDRLMVVSSWWSGEFEQVRGATVVGADMSVTEASFPALPAGSHFNEELVGTDDGFVVSLSDFQSAPGSPANVSIWHTDDGQHWELITESAPLEDAQFIWNLRQHRSRYFVSGQGAELQCEEGNGRCEFLVRLWSSPDGRSWREVLTQDSEPISTYQIGDGPLGLVAFGDYTTVEHLPRTVYLSHDGTEWTAEDGIALQNPTSINWWVSGPAVGEDTVLAVGSSYPDPTSGQSDTFFIIGRIVDD